MTASMLQRLSVSALVAECESLTASGDLNPSQEASLRLLVAHTLAAFGMPSKHERACQRAANNNRAPDADLHSLFDPSFDEILEVLRAQMGATL